MLQENGYIVIAFYRICSDEALQLCYIRVFCPLNLIRAFNKWNIRLDLYTSDVKKKFSLFISSIRYFNYTPEISYVHLFERNVTSDLFDGSAIRRICLREEYTLNLRCKVSRTNMRTRTFPFIDQYSMRISRGCDSKHAVMPEHNIMH